MISARQMIGLLQSLNEGDEEQFYAIALQVAATEAKRGRIEVATELKFQVDLARSKKRPTPRLEKKQGSVVSFSKPRGELQGLLTTTASKVKLDSVSLESHVADRLQSFVRQQRQRERLRGHSRTPRATALLVGPPGSGKTFTANAIAGELHLPLYSIRLDSVISRYMGETAARLRLVFDQIAIERAVYLFDEFDAIGGKRTNDNDVGEMRRVLNSFLQFLEERNSTDSPVIAATNHPELLDAALLRRFDDVIVFPLPSANVIEDLLRRRIGYFDSRSVNWDDVIEKAQGLSQAEIVRATDEVVKNAILSDVTVLTTGELVAALDQRKSLLGLFKPAVR